MPDDRSGRELTPREPAEVEATDASLTPVQGESRDVERFSAGPRAHSVGLTEERAAQVVRQSANARNVVFLAILIIALFIPVYWFYENGIPALGAEGRMVAEVEEQYVTDVARGYELYLANCSQCHGESGQGGIGPRLNDQGKLYNVLTPGGDAGTGHLNPGYIHNVLNVGGRYVCGDPDSLMASWQQPAGPLNYRQVEELIAWITASQDVVFERHVVSHGADAANQGEPEVISGWRDPDYQPGPDDTPVPDCWKAPNGLAPAQGDGGTTATATTAPEGGGETAAPAITGGTPENPRQIELVATASLQFTDTSGAQVTQIEVMPGETVEFVVDNTANFDHNFWIGDPAVLQGAFAETDVGVPAWQSGVQTITWTVPESGAEGLQFACTVPGHYTSMHGDIVISAGTPAGDGGTAPAEQTPTESAPADGTTADGTTADGTTGDSAPAGGDGAAAAGGTPDNPRVINLTATAALQFTDDSGTIVNSIGVTPGETIEFVVDNTAGFDHDFWIGTAEELQGSFAETDVGIPVWSSGVQSVVWTVPEEGAEVLQFACTVPGHYTPMHGNFQIQG
jgi:uncharacterized cupredoxin-like copper-binding protein/mono/diheme cytochrome c family protein